jgi:hypothetical protein
MKRLRRCLYSAVVWGSLLLCVITASFIIRSFVRTDMLEHFTPGRTTGSVLRRSRVRLVTGRGIFYLLLMSETETTTNAADMANYRLDFEGIPPWIYNVFPASWPTPVDHSWLGCGYSSYALAGSNGWATPQARELRIPLWFPLALFAALPIARWLVHRRQFAAGMCSQCGYDLRATPNRCPECGTIPPKGIITAIGSKRSIADEG